GGVVADGRVRRVEREEQVRHHGAVTQRRLERGRAQRLASDRAVYVRDAEEDELLVAGCPRRLLPAGGPCLLDGAHSFSFTALSTACIVSRNRSTISWSSFSGLVNAGASTTSSPTQPSGVECVD